MSVKRIQDIDIKTKGLFVGLYGVNGQEFYLDSDLRKYNFYQQLSIYLKEEGYDKVVMYDAVNNFHSYFKTDLDQLKYSSKTPQQSKENKSRVKNSIGRRRKPQVISETQENPNTSITFNTTGDKRNGFYRDQMNTRIRDYFQREINNSKAKTAFIIKDFNNLGNDQQDSYISLFREAQQNYIINNSRNKVIIIYDSISSESLVEKFHQNRGKLMYNKFFEEIFIKSNDGSNDVNINTTFKIENPQIDEIRYFINYQRVVKNIAIDYLKLDALSSSINSQKYSLVELHKNFKKVKSINLEELKNAGIVENKEMDIDRAKLNHLVQKIKGQEDNSKVITEQIILWNNLYKGQSPLNLFLVGASGVGKTYTTKVIGSLLKSNGFDYELIALSEFKSEHERSKLFGAPPGYAGGDATPRLLESIKKNNGKLVICFDEVEEAHPQIMSSLVNLLEEGTIAFNVKGKTIIEDFSKCIIFFTSNTAMEKLVEYKKQFITNGGNINSEEFKQRVFEHLNKEELLHKKLQRRIEKFLVYGTLPPRAIIEIAYEEITKLFKRRKWTLAYCDPTYLSRIAVNASNQISGIDSIEGAIKSEIAPIVLKSNFQKDSTIQLNCKGNIVSLNENDNEHNYTENIEQALELFAAETENQTSINKLSEEKLNHLVQKIKGQEDNSKVITEQIILWNNLYKGQSPLNLFLVGASGVGKTYTTKVIGSLLKSNGFGYELIALSEFKSEHERSKLFGAPPGYAGGDATPRLLESIKKNNGKLVICFDEVEEAHPQIMSSLVNLLEEGTIAFNVKGKTIIEDFSKCIIFFTSNTAMEKLVEYKKQFITNGGNINSEEFKQRVFEHLNKEELLHKKLQRRIEKFLVYGTLPPRAIIEIAYEEITKLFKRRKWTLAYCDPTYLSRIAVNASNQISGIDSIEGAIKSEIAPIVLKSNFQKDSTIQLNCKGNIVSLNENDNEHNYTENIEQALELFFAKT